MKRIHPNIPADGRFEPRVPLVLPHDEGFMRLALELAMEAAAEGEVPVGAVIAERTAGEYRVIASARNTRELEKTASGHAELRAIDEACRVRGDWRLTDCTLYVTLEPCPMCAGAVLNAHLPRVVYGAKDARAGAFGSVVNLAAYPLGFTPEVVPGVLADECSALMRGFFSSLREKRK